jgi:IS5 family transposase
MLPGFFDHQERLELRERLGEPLPRLERAVDWGGFRVLLANVYKNSEPGKGGRPPKAAKAPVASRVASVNEQFMV